MHLDYRALSNAGLWRLGRLQTDADRERVMDSLAVEDPAFGTTLQRLAPRRFVVRDAQESSVPVLLHPRHTMTLMRGPMTRSEIRKARSGVTPSAARGPMPSPATPELPAAPTLCVTPTSSVTPRSEATRGPVDALDSAE